MPSKLGVQDNINKYFPFLMEIRRRILFVLCIFLISGILGFVYYEKIVMFIIGLLNLKGINIVFTSPFQFINLAVSSGILIGTACSFPTIIQQILSFLRPALTKKEYKTIIILLPLSIILFIGGFAFGFSMMRYVISLFYAKSLELNIGNLLDITDLLSKILITSSLMGLAFQYPIVLSLLMRFKVVKYKTIVAQRPFAYVLAIVFAAFLPPTDIFSLILLTLPLVILFETTLILNKVFLKAHLL